MGRRLWLLAVGIVVVMAALPAAGVPSIRPPAPPVEVPGTEDLKGDRIRDAVPGTSAGDRREAGSRPSTKKGAQKAGGRTSSGHAQRASGRGSGRPYRIGRGERFTWAKYRPASGSGLFPLSGTAELGFMEARGELPATQPAGTVAPLPANFGPNILVSQDLSSMPHNETSVAINPKDPNNIVVGANDYRMGGPGGSGFYATTDGGKTWYDGLLPFPSVYFEPIRPLESSTGVKRPAAGRPNARRRVVPVGEFRSQLALDGGGDPAVAFDRDGTVYYAEIEFHRTGCASMILVRRSVNGGRTWSRPLFGEPLPGDTRNEGDGVVVMNANDNNCLHFYDKEYLAVGPRPAGAPLVTGTDMAHLTSDRVYVTYTDFQLLPPVGAQPFVGPTVYVASPIMVSYSDDQGRHWSQPQEISGASQTLCSGSPMAGRCVTDQGSVPAVDPRTGKVHVYFFNSDTADDPVTQQVAPLTNQIQIPAQLLMVSSSDGGASWSDPVLVADIVDDNLPRAGDAIEPGPGGEAVRCPDQQPGRQVLGDTCFRWVAFGNPAVDPATGRVYAVWSDNRNGTKETVGSGPTAMPRYATDVDIFLATSEDGSSWSEPKRVNTDPLGNRKDQFFPWVAVGPDGAVHVSFLDRARDPANHDVGATLCISRDRAASFTCAPSSTGMWDPDLAFRSGLFIGDYTGIAVGPNGSFAAWPDARRARPSAQGDNPSSVFSEVVGSFSSHVFGARAASRTRNRS
jgi:hypothetical protein